MVYRSEVLESGFFLTIATKRNLNMYKVQLNINVNMIFKTLEYVLELEFFFVNEFNWGPFEQQSSVVKTKECEEH